MPDDNNDDSEFTTCCANFYNHPLVLMLLDGILHPGGLALSSLMAEKMHLNHDSNVLDIACGMGMTASYLAKSIGCQVTGIDVGEELIEQAKKKAIELCVEEKTNFRVALANSLPFDDGSFSAAYSECAVCTFTQKKTAAFEVARVLEPSGFLGISDMTLLNKEDLDEELKSQLGRIACIADALSSDGYVELFTEVGFTLVEQESQSKLLEEMVKKIRYRSRFFGSIGIIDEEGDRLMDEALKLINKALDQINAGNLGYDLMIFKKEA